MRNIQLPQSKLALWVTRTSEDLQLKLVNDGASLKLLFQPELPLGARIAGAELNGKSIRVSLEQHSQTGNARIEMEIPSGTATINVRYQGGISLVLPASQPLVGNASRNIKIIRQNLSGNNYVLDAEVNPAQASTFQLITHWKIVNVDGASQRLIASHTYEFTIPPSKVSGGSSGYVPVSIHVTIAR